MLSFGILVLPKTVLSIWYVFFVDFAITTHKMNSSRHYLACERACHELWDWRVVETEWHSCEYSQRAARSFVRGLEIRLKGGFPVLARSSSQLAASACMSTLMHALAARYFVRGTSRISSPRTKLLAASACMSTFIQSQCWTVNFTSDASTRSELRGASCEDWKSALSRENQS